MGVMRPAVFLACLVAPVALAATASFLGACDSGPADSGSDAAPDTNVGPQVACITPPTPAAFPSGSCTAPQPQTPDAYDEALAAIGLDRCSVIEDPTNMPLSVMNVYDKRQLPDFKPLLQYPLRLPDYGNETAKWFDDAMAGPTPVSSALAAAAVRIGLSPAQCPDPAWFIVDGNDPAPLTTALGNMASTYGADFDPAATSAALAGVPIDLRRAVAVIVNALSAAWQTISDARAAAASYMPRFQLAPDWIRGLTSYIWSTGQLAAWDGVDIGAMAQAALWVSTAIESVQLTRFAGATFDPVELDTPLGKLVLHGAGNDDYEPGSGVDNALFLLDTGGDDTYKVPVGATTLQQQLSIAVDLGGKDTYGYVPVPNPDDNIGHRLPSDSGGRSYGISRSRTLREGAALLGVGMLFDYGQDGDTYRSLADSQGVGVFGVGVLYDQGGDDDYAAESLCQGGGAFGIGLLLDGGGNDKYLAYNSAQGFGFTRGIGALVDEAGDDSYYTDPGDPAVGGDALYPNAQLPGVGNTSMSQGCGEGHRPDSPEPGYQFPGGLGVLRDAHGKDSYVTSVFGQACSFAMGMGMLLEGDGDDTYEGLWYVQGANAHTSVAYFDDKAGNDQYDPTFPIRATSIGVGHDYSVALHWDEGGDDTYHGPGLSLGSGNDNGIGLMLVTGGTDTFRADAQNSLGSANCGDLQGTSRAKIQTLGMFVKASGTGSYTVGGVDAGSYPGGSWSYAPDNKPDAGLTAEKSVGMDRPNASASWP
jgi:hypothetical protein